MGWLMPNWRGLFHIQMKLIIGTWDELRESAMSVRRKVFIQEQNIPEDLEWDELDTIATHVVVTDNHRAIATARLIPGIQYKIGRMAVLRAERSKGLGELVLKTLLDEAKLAGYEGLALHAQVSAAPFYQKQGFQGPIQRL